MSILIDPPSWPAHGTVFSHLVSDASLAELHAFAAASDLPERAFDEDHYDVPQQRYQELLTLGASPVDGGTLVRALIRSGLRVPARERPAALEGPLMKRWAKHLPSVPELGAELLARWAEPHRKYHTRVHLLGVLEALDAITPDGDSRPVRLAAWFHDAVHTGTPGQDEADSALLAEERLRAAGLGNGEIAEVVRLVRCTADHRVESDDHDGGLLCDADLSILGSSPEDYGKYTARIRQEYAHVPAEDFRAGRADVLSRLLLHEPLYRTDAGRDRWEASARRNLRAELALLHPERTGLHSVFR